MTAGERENRRRSGAASKEIKGAAVEGSSLLPFDRGGGLGDRDDLQAGAVEESRRVPLHIRALVFGCRSFAILLLPFLENGASITPLVLRAKEMDGELHHS